MLNNQTDVAPKQVIPQDLNLRKPETQDGTRVHNLIKNCPFLDENSRYCNLLQCTDFADTCVVAEFGGDIVGFISGYIPPKKPNVLFIWQVAIDQRIKGIGAEQRMLQSLLLREECSDVNYIETNINRDSNSSRNMFASFAQKRGWTAEKIMLSESRLYFSNKNSDEIRLKIGPFNLKQPAKGLCM